MTGTALLLALARTSSLVPEGGILRGRVHVVLEGDNTPPPGDAVQVVLGTSETAAGGWGDGAHPSTALCLEWLSERGFKEDESFLDYGCGSGVLAIAARKLGCPTAVGVDVEYEALESAAENAARNGSGRRRLGPRPVRRAGHGRVRRRRGEHPGISRRFSNHDLHAIDATVHPTHRLICAQVGSSPGRRWSRRSRSVRK